MDSAPPDPKRLDPLLRRLVYGRQVGPGHLVELDLLSRIDAAHCTMLCQCGHLDAGELDRLRAAVRTLRRDGFAALLGRSLERGLYMLYEDALRERVGPALAGKIHLGRSRNDLNATLYRLRLRPAFLRLEWSLLRLTIALARAAERGRTALLPHQTHFQLAFPVTLGHYLNAIAAAVSENCAWLRDGARDLDTCPLGAGAGGGTSVPIKPALTAQLLGFERSWTNSIDAVANRDVGLRILAAAAIAGGTLDRFCTDLATWLASETRFALLPDDLVGASSMLPQKRNPFAIEHIRAWLRAAGTGFVSASAMMHGTVYSNSIEAGTEAAGIVFPAIDRMVDACILLRRLVTALRWDNERATAAAGRARVGAFVEAEQLALEGGLSFRAAHETLAGQTGGRRYATAASAPPPAAALSPNEALPPDRALARLRYGGGAADDEAGQAGRAALAAALEDRLSRHRQTARRWQAASRRLTVLAGL